MYVWGQVGRSTLPMRAGLYPSVSVTAQSSPVLPPPVDRRHRRRSDPVNRLSAISAGSEGELGRPLSGGVDRQSAGLMYQGLMPANLDEDAFVWQTVTTSGARLVLPRSGAHLFIAVSVSWLTKKLWVFFMKFGAVFPQVVQKH